MIIILKTCIIVSICLFRHLLNDRRVAAVSWLFIDQFEVCLTNNSHLVKRFGEFFVSCFFSLSKCKYQCSKLLILRLQSVKLVSVKLSFVGVSFDKNVLLLISIICQDNTCKLKLGGKLFKSSLLASKTCMGMKV